MSWVLLRIWPLTCPCLTKKKKAFGASIINRLLSTSSPRKTPHVFSVFLAATREGVDPDMADTRRDHPGESSSHFSDVVAFQIRLPWVAFTRCQRLFEVK